MSIFKILTLNRILNEATHKDFDLDKINVDDPSTYPMWTNGKPMTKARVLSLMAARYRDWETDRKSTRLNSSHITRSRMPSSA